MVIGRNRQDRRPAAAAARRLIHQAGPTDGPGFEVAVARRSGSAYLLNGYLG